MDRGRGVPGHAAIWACARDKIGSAWSEKAGKCSKNRIEPTDAKRYAIKGRIYRPRHRGKSRIVQSLMSAQQTKVSALDPRRNNQNNCFAAKAVVSPRGPSEQRIALIVSPQCLECFFRRSEILDPRLSLQSWWHECVADAVLGPVQSAV